MIREIMPFTQEDYYQAPVLATAELLGTKRSRILDDEENHIMTFNKYDIDNVAPRGNVLDHFNAMNAMAAQKGDVLMSFTVNNEDLVAKTIRSVWSTNPGEPLDIYPEICAALPSLYNFDPADGNEFVQLAMTVSTSDSSDDQEAFAQDPKDWAEELYVTDRKARSEDV